MPDTDVLEGHQVAIVGSGLAGACVAALLARHGGIAAERIVLLGEPINPPAGGAPPRLRVVALSRASEQILAAAGAWSRLPRERLTPYEKMRVWHESGLPESAGALCFEAADIGEPNLGYIAENDLLRWACLASFREAGGQLLPERVTRLEFQEREVCLTLESGAALSAKLVIGADGARSQVREQADLAVRGPHEYHQRAVVATMRGQRLHRHTAWQRFLAGGPLALLPLFDGSVSLVWSVAAGVATQLVSQSAHAFESSVREASGEVLGALTLESARHSFPLFTQAAERYVRPRCALLGDAAHVIHPLAGQGANLGLLDAAALCDSIAAAVRGREDPGALRALRGYEQQRRTHNLTMAAAMSALEYGLAARGRIAAVLVRAGLGGVQHSDVLRRWFARQALGGDRVPPRLARGASLQG